MKHDVDAAPAAVDRPAADLTTLAVLQEQFLTTIGQVDPSTRVPWCGRWRVQHLVVHLGRIHHWAAGQARRRQETPLGRGPFVLDEFYAAQATELRETLAGLDPDAPAWTLDDSGVVRFWHRRQVHETLVHLWDLRTAGGLHLDVAPGLWADTVDEVVHVMQPRQVALGRTAPLPVRLTLVAADAGRTWTLDAVDEAPAVEVAGPAASLALLVWGRTTPDDRDLRVTGDRAALLAALGAGLTP
ncbi:maleylpyruvate isomerase family mycothiol-dependent enzyme [Cellulomonas phragmiteti]|uniref:Maleylpyruvate isomerase family mycothiol-dependent enzyme n=1 Tax=Cellulomonas phragmiteti TaxID=478780 RepID=A0ABQ4DKN9_9CELL|nr:maleylpyruvate isomerase family mycothiol-dependent enzyme [Cellulomonas phragmiteti]GIG39898.1 hypothetical protein Cph01nite_16600 [Cellulomonas phragmiteti]